MRASLCFLALVTLLAGGLAAQNFDSVEIKTHKLTDSVYMLVGSGGNIGVSVGEDGILIVDDQFAPLADKIRAALADLKTGEIDWILNTHWHFDHVGGNEVFGFEAAILAHENVRKRMAEGSQQPRPVPPAPAHALPVITYDDSVTLHLNGDEIYAYHVPSAHTDGDSYVWFKSSNVVHLGDNFFNGGTFPFVDIASGGNVFGLVENIRTLVEELPADIQIIPGHGPLASKADLEGYLGMLEATSSWVKKGKEAGKTLEQLQEEGLPGEWKDYGSGGFINATQWILFTYQSLE